MNEDPNDEYKYALFLYKNKYLPGPTVCDLCGGNQFVLYRDKYAKTSLSSFGGTLYSIIQAYTVSKDLPHFLLTAARSSSLCLMSRDFHNCFSVNVLIV